MKLGYGETRFWWIGGFYRFSRTKKCSTTKLEAVNVTKKMPSNVMFGHQKDCARSPNVERIVAAGTSSSTPYCVKQACQIDSQRTGNDTDFVFLKLEEAKLVDGECLKCSVEERDGMQPL